MNPFAIVAALIIFIFVLGLIGSEDMKEEKAQIEHYCEMVQAGAWPDYDKTINCNEGENDDR